MQASSQPLGLGRDSWSQSFVHELGAEHYSWHGVILALILAAVCFVLVYQARPSLRVRDGLA